MLKWSDLLPSVWLIFLQEGAYPGMSVDLCWFSRGCSQRAFINGLGYSMEKLHPYHYSSFIHKPIGQGWGRLGKKWTDNQEWISFLIFFIWLWRFKLKGLGYCKICTCFLLSLWSFTICMHHLRFKVTPVQISGALCLQSFLLSCTLIHKP